MPFVHQVSLRLAPRILGAVRLLEQATTDSEREAAAGLIRTLGARGVVAESIEIDVPAGEPARLSDDGLLLVRGTVWWKGLVLAGLGGALGFHQHGKVVETDGAGRWRVWFVGPAGSVLGLRLWFATLSLLVACASRSVHRGGMSLVRTYLALAIGAVGAAGQEARMRAPRGAMVLWCEPPAEPEPEREPGQQAQEGEGTKQLKSFMGMRPFFQDVLEAGQDATWRARRLW